MVCYVQRAVGFCSGCLVSSFRVTCSVLFSVTQVAGLYLLGTKISSLLLHSLAFSCSYPSNSCGKLSLQCSDHYSIQRHLNNGSYGTFHISISQIVFLSYSPSAQALWTCSGQHANVISKGSLHPWPPPPQGDFLQNLPSLNGPDSLLQLPKSEI